MFLVTGLFGGVFATAASAATLPACTTTQTTAACTATFTMTSAGLAVHGNAVNALTPLTSFKGTVSPLGTISGITLPTISYRESPSTINTYSTETVVLSQTSPSAETGSINYQGDVTITDALSLFLTIRQPDRLQCRTSPLDVALTGTYNASTKDLTLSDTRFTIPDFTAKTTGSTCGLVADELSQRISGSTGNVLDIGLRATLPLPPPPVPTTTTLSATPATPQLAGSSVTLKATVEKSTHALATTASGTLDFYNGSTLLSSKTVASGTASFTTTALPGGTNELHAVYSGNGQYLTSTSPTVSYVVIAKPTVSLNLPSSVTVGATPTQFSVKVTNPADGENWTKLILRLTISNITQTGVPPPVLSYKDSGGNWCSFGLTGGAVMTVTFHGLGTPPCGASTDFSLPAGHSLTLPLEVSYPSADRVGVQHFTASLYTYTPTTGVVPPFTGTSAAPIRAQGTYTVNPVSKYTPTVTATALPTYSVPQGFVVRPGVTVTQPATPSHLPTPHGTLEFLVTTAVLATYTYTSNTDNTATFPTAILSVGTHTFEADYLGDHVYNAASYTHTFTVGPPLSGTPFTCVVHPPGAMPEVAAAAVTVSASPLPAGAPSGSPFAVSDLDVTLTYDNHANVRTPQTSDVISLSPNGVAPGSSVTPVVTNDAATMSWTDLSTTVSISGAVGTKVNVGVKTIDMTFQSLGGTNHDTCTAVSAPASLGTVTVSGTTLSASPASPVVTGTPVTLTATVYPTPATGSTPSQVQFFDGTTGVGTELVSTTGASRGTASVTLTPAVGTHSFTATWTGDPSAVPSIPFNVSNAVSFVVNPTPVVPPPAPPAPPAPGSGYSLVASNGAVYSYGTAPFYGSMGGKSLSAPIVGTATTPGDGGYWLVASDGGIFSFGNATFYGSMGGKALNKPIVGMATTQDQGGYWEVASDGGIFSFGDAVFSGSMGGKPLNAPMVGIAAA